MAVLPADVVQPAEYPALEVGRLNEAIIVAGARRRAATSTRSIARSGSSAGRMAATAFRKA
jgi:hypothetical protein